MTKDIIAAVGKRQVLRGHNPVCANIQVCVNWECDVLSISKAGRIYEFEVKISRTDFMKEKYKSKSKWKRMGANQKHDANKPHYMSYVCPTGLIKLKELNEKIGLYYYCNGELTEIREPQALHNDIGNIRKLEAKIVRLYSERAFLGCALMTHENREAKKRWDKFEADRNEEMKKFEERMKEIAKNKTE